MRLSYQYGTRLFFHDEIGLMAVAINNMIESLREIGNKFMNETDNLTRSADQLNGAIEEVVQGASIQSSEIDLSATGMEQLSQTVDIVAHHASDLLGASQQALQFTSHGKVTVEQSRAVTMEVGNAVSNWALTMKELDANSKEISKIITVIDAIASQTNLLSLNAAIEAARAGEQGRGFAVVAEEVRGLAQQTAHATKEVAYMVHNIQNNVMESIQSIEIGKEHANRGIEFADEVSDAIDEIASAAEHASALTDNIVSVIDEEAIVARQLSDNMENIAKITNNTGETTNLMRAGADRLSKVAAELKESASWFKL